MTDEVTVNTAPHNPETMHELMCMTADEAGRLSLRLLNYIRTGDINMLKHATNHLLCLQNMGTKNIVLNLISCGMRGVHPLSAEERKELYLKMVQASNEDTPA